MTRQEFDRVCLHCVEIFRNIAPKDTGNLAFNSIRYEYISEDEFKIYVDTTIAPYMVYTNEPWTSPKWHGKKNPNQYWWEHAKDKVIEYIAQEFNGEVK